MDYLGYDLMLNMDIVRKQQPLVDSAYSSAYSACSEWRYVMHPSDYVDTAFKPHLQHALEYDSLDTISPQELLFTAPQTFSHQRSKSEGYALDVYDMALVPPVTPASGSEETKKDSKPYKCTMCTSSFSRNHDLKRHVRFDFINSESISESDLTSVITAKSRLQGWTLSIDTPLSGVVKEPPSRTFCHNKASVYKFMIKFQRDLKENLVLIELQGSLEQHGSHLGELVGNDLFIGNHKLHGQRVVLDKPLLLCTKNDASISVNHIIREKLLYHLLR